MTVVRKELKDMTLEELWALFPIVLVPHKLEWKEWAEEEIAFLGDLLSDFSPVINHIGSTAIPTIWAKPIIDILVEVPYEENNNSPSEIRERIKDKERIKELMEGNGYICMSESGDRMSFNKGYTPEGYAERVFHIHFHRVGDNDEVYFRDYLIKHPEVAKEYEVLKLGLLPEYRNNRDGYTEAKPDFVSNITAIAKS